MSIQLPLTTDRLHTAKAFYECAPDQFRPGFGDWLADNWALYLRFEREACATAKVHDHYGANTIIEFLRHETLVRDRDGEFKLNDKWTSSIARLFHLLNPAHADLFEFRQRAGGVVQSPRTMKVAA